MIVLEFPEEEGVYILEIANVGNRAVSEEFKLHFAVLLDDDSL